MYVALIGHEVGSKLRGSQEERGKENDGRTTASIIIIITVKKEKSAMDTEGYSFLLHSFSGRFHLSFFVHSATF